MAVAIASSASATPGAGTTITISAPSGITTDDLLLAWVTTDGLDAIDPATGGPSGWTCYPAHGNASSQSITAQLWWKIAVLADESASNYSWTIDSSEYYDGHIMRITGADPSNPFERMAEADGDSTQIDCPPLNPRKNDGMLVCCGGMDNDRGPLTKPTAMTSQYSSSNGGAGGVCCNVAYLTLTTQYTSTGTQSFTGASTGDEWGAISAIVNSDESALTDGEIKTGVFTSPTDGSDTTVTISAEAKAILFFSSLQTSTGLSDHAIGLIGMSTGASDEASLTSASEDNLSAVSNCNSSMSKTDAIRVLDESGSVLIEGDVKSISSTQFVIQWTTYDGSNAYKIYYVAFCGGGVEASIVDFTAKTSTGTQTYAHGLSALPTTFFSMGVYQTSLEAILAGTSISFGWSSDNILGSDANKQLGARLHEVDNVAASDVSGAVDSSAFLTIASPSGVVDAECDVSDIDTTNVTLNWTDGASSAWQCSIMCIAGIRASAKKISILSTDSGITTYPLDGSGVLPQALLLIFEYVINREEFAFGAGTSSTSRWIQGQFRDDFVEVTQVFRHSSEILVLDVYHSGQVSMLSADIDSFAFDQILLDIENADSVDRNVWVLALETIPYEVSGTDVTATLETLSFTKYNTSINAKNQVDATLETLSLTTYNTTVVVLLNVVCTLETLSLTSYNATIEAKNQIVATLETLSFTTYASVVNAKSQVDATLETLSLAVYASVVNDQTNIDATLETLSFTAYNATIEAKNQIDATLETLGLTAYEAIVTVGMNIVCTLETLSFTTYNTTVQADNEVDLSLEALALTPYTADVNAKQQVVSTLGSLSFAAYAAEVKLNVNVVSTLEQLIFTEYNTTVQVIPGGFFRDMKGNLDGLGSGGPFFKNPLG